MNKNFSPADHATATAIVPPDRRHRKPRKWVWLIVLAVLAAAAVAGWWVFMRADTASAVPTTITVQSGSVQETVLASGALKASALVSVGAQVSGTVKSVDVSLGDNVEAGDLVAEIDDTDLQLALRSATASLNNVLAQRDARQSAVEQSEAALKRSTELRDKGLLSDADYQSAVTTLAASTADLASLDSQIEQARIAAESAQSDLSRTKITAPLAGTVVAVLVDEGQTVSATQEAPTIIKIANLDTMLVKAEISEADVARVKPGQKVYFNTLGDTGTKIEATLKSIEPAPTSIETSDDISTDSAIYYNGIFEAQNPDHSLRIGMTAEVTIILDEADDVLTLPASVLTHELPDGAYAVQVYHPETGAMTPQRITVGLNNGVTAEITSGVEEGDQVLSGSASAPSRASSANSNAGGPSGGVLGGPPPRGL